MAAMRAFAANKLNFMLAGVIGGIIIADLITKQWAIAALKGESAIVLLPVLRFIYVENTGVSFGMFADGGDIGRWLLVAVAVGLSVFLVYYMRQAETAGEKWACALMLGGAIGNMIDRTRYGYVVDFIDAHVGGYHWPTFNIADIAISCGGVLFAYVLLFRSGGE